MAVLAISVSRSSNVFGSENLVLRTSPPAWLQSELELWVDGAVLSVDRREAPASSMHYVGEFHDSYTKLRLRTTRNTRGRKRRWVQMASQKETYGSAASGR